MRSRLPYGSKPLVCALALACASSAGAATVGQSDDFQNGAQDWTSGFFNPNPPFVVQTGGPGGVGDAFLQITATGVELGAGGRLTAFNENQWTGSYDGATEIHVDLKNLGAVGLEIRLGFEGAGGVFATSFEAVVAPGGDWQSFVFPIGPDDLTGAFTGGGTSVALTLASTTKLRLSHSPVPASSGGGFPPVAGVLGVDNITLVPEPATFGAALAAIAGLAALRRRAQRVR